MGVDASGGDEAEDNNIEENALLLLNLGRPRTKVKKFLLRKALDNAQPNIFKSIQVKPDSQLTRAHGTCTGNSGKR